MRPTVVLLLLLGGTSVVWFFMTLLVVLSKAGRDRRERVAKEQRLRYRDALEAASSTQLGPILRELFRKEGAQVDMLAVLDEAAPSQRAIHALREVDRIQQLSESLEYQSCGEEPVARGISALLLARMGLDRCTPVADRLLRDEDPDVRLAACSALAEIGTNAAARSLIQSLREGTMPAERLIERLGAPWANDEVLLALDESDDPRLRTALVRALGLAPDRRALEMLVHLSEHGEDEERVSAVRTLGSTGPADKVVPVLCGALTDGTPAVRAQAARAIGTLSEPSSPNWLETSIMAAERLRSCLGDDDWWVRANAATALRSLGKAGEHQLIDALDDPDEFSRDRARESLELLKAGTTAG